MTSLPLVRTEYWNLSQPGTVRNDPTGHGESVTDMESYLMPAAQTAADNRLLLDLDNAGHREQLRVALTRSRHRTAVLQEGLPGPGDAWLPGPRDRHVVELVVPLVMDRRRSGRAGRDHGGPEPRRDRRAAPRWPDADRLRPPGPTGCTSS